jgi:hypothetical protein
MNISQEPQIVSSVFFLWRYCQNWPSTASLLRFLDHAPLDTSTHPHTHGLARTHTSDSTLLNEVSARRRGCYLLNIQQTTEMNIYAFSGIRTHYPAIRRPQTYAWDGTATGISKVQLYFHYLLTLPTVIQPVKYCCLPYIPPGTTLKVSILPTHSMYLLHMMFAISSHHFLKPNDLIFLHNEKFSYLIWCTYRILCCIKRNFRFRNVYRFAY